MSATTSSSGTNKITGNPCALLPILIFMVLYLGLGLTFEYVMNMQMGFYLIPVVGPFIVAIIFACCQHHSISIDKKLDIMARGLADKNILTMLFIFLLAGFFVGVVGRSSAESVAYFMLSIVPPEYSVVILFIITCFVSLSMGTSVGTITLITPIAVEVSELTGFSLPLCVATVISGAMFGDNLSFISDTTVAACNGQGCPMNTKFKENFKIAFPAAVLAILTIISVTFNSDHLPTVQKDFNLILVVPYVLVLLCGIIGMNVFVILILGIITGICFTLTVGGVTAVDLIVRIGKGTSGMFETCMVAILVSALCSLIKYTGGFTSLLNGIHTVFHGRKMGQIGIGMLVGAMDLATANNTVAIVMVNPIASQMAKEYGVSRRRTASILDIFSCIFQGVIPYGAQMLVAISVVFSFEKQISALDIIPHMYYLAFLLISILIYIFALKASNETELSKNN